MVDIGFFGISVKKGELAIIGSKAGVGQSALAYSIFRNIGIINCIPTGLITTGKFSGKDLIWRLISYETGIKYIKLLKGLLNDDDVAKISSAVRKLNASPFFTEDLPNGSFNEIEAAVKIMAAEKHCEIIFIDGLDYLNEVENGKMNMSEVVSQYKNLAQSENLAVIMLMDLPAKDVAVTRTADASILLDIEIANDYENNPTKEARLLYCRNGCISEYGVFLENGMCTAGVAGGV